MPVTAHLIDIVLVLIAVEALGLLVFLRSKSRMELAPAAIFFLLSGAALMAVIRLALTDNSALNIWGQMFLSAAFITHISAIVALWQVIGRR